MSDAQRDEWLLKMEPLQGARPRWEDDGRSPGGLIRRGLLTTWRPPGGGGGGVGQSEGGTAQRSEPDVAAGAADFAGGGENATEEGGSRTRGPSGARTSVTSRRDTSSSPNFFGGPAKRRRSGPTEWQLVTRERVRGHSGSDATGNENRLLRTPGVQPVVPTPRQAAFTTTKVPWFGGTTSWEQYQQVFDAIVLSNGWDDATAALQLLSHLQGDALNVALLVPMARRTSRKGLVDALSAHYGSPGRLADYRWQFEKTTRSAEDDPSIFAIALETLA